MNGDFSRFSHKRAKHYSRVLRQQGRVDLDADHNEQAEIQHHLDRATRRDVIGYAGYPVEKGAFKLTPTPDNADLFISTGRFYVDGLLVEVDTTWIPFTPAEDNNKAVDVAAPDPDGRPFAAGQWVELTGHNATPRRFKVTGVGGSDKLRLTLDMAMPDYLDPFRAEDAEPRLRRLPTVLTQPDAPEGVTLSPGAGKTVVLYLEVFERHVSEVEDPDLKEKALGGPDTATRVKTVWRVLAKDAAGSLDCEDDAPGWPPAQSRGRLTTSATVEPHSDDPCSMPPQGGYRGMENRLYRVQIHEGGDVGDATYKWSRDNGAITYAISGRVTGEPAKVRLRRLGRDRMLSLRKEDWVEVLSDVEESKGEAGDMFRVVDVDLATDTVTLSGNVPAIADHLRPKLRRWDGKAGVADTHGDAVELESGVRVSFSGRAFRPGDHWAFAARVADRSVEPLHAAPPMGVHRRHAKLGLLTVEGGKWSVHDCRKPFKPLTDACGCECTVTVGDGVSSHGDYTDLQKAIDAAGARARVCILPGTHRLPDTVLVRSRHHLTIEGSGRAARIHAPEGKPALRVEGSDHVTLEGLHVEALGSAPAVILSRSRRVTVRRSTLATTRPGSDRVDPPRKAHLADHDEAWPDPDEPEEHDPGQQTSGRFDCDPAGNALFAARCHRLLVEDCLLVGLPALSLQGGRLRVERNRIEGGGLWLREGTVDALVEGNEVSNGRGHGIELGGQAFADPEPPRDVEHVVIRANRIHRMDGSGIASRIVARMRKEDYLLELQEGATAAEAAAGEEWELREGGEGSTLRDVDVLENEVRACARRPPMAARRGGVPGGIVLQRLEGGRIRDNRVADNGRAEDVRAVGILVMGGWGVDVRGNTVLDNGTGRPTQAETLEVDYTRGDHPARDGPNRVDNGFRIVVEDDDGEPASSTKVIDADGLRGLHLGTRTTIRFPAGATRFRMAVYAPKGGAVHARGQETRDIPPTQGAWHIMESDDPTLGVTIEPESGGILGWLRIQPATERPQGGIVCTDMEPPQEPLVVYDEIPLRKMMVMDSAGGSAPDEDAQLQRSRPRGAASRGVLAVGVHDNVVTCPEGVALYVSGVGAMAISGNVLTSYGPHPGNPEREFHALCAWVANGHRGELFPPRPQQDDASKDENADGRPDEEEAPFEQDEPNQVLFEGNVAVLEAPEGKANEGGFGVIVACSGDVGLLGNQVRTAVPGASGGIVAVGQTVRAQGNRILEPDAQDGFSLAVGAERAIVTGNQATHCIHPAISTAHLIVEQNQLLGRPPQKVESCDAGWYVFLRKMSEK